MIVTLQGGDGRGYPAAVDSGGSVQTSVSNTVTTRRAVAEVYRTTGTVGTSSGQLLAGRTGRRGLRIQNHHSTNSVWVRLGDLDATDDDWLVAAGKELVLDDIPFEGAVQAIASGSDTDVLALEFA